ncbi:DUF382-domain-containing protein [Histomonas meleagridis]|uniref:DUF382-domain-containing protein n=1 Tax=Histomonas meleagridis TaxID=135588 RepID=UPI00355AC7B6|nr:DUF382-domain-containing protein [Histomonas meleagridis]KAH0804430.1 DUF382-domain-containing protein [Histomonas meleagridis]
MQPNNNSIRKHKYRERRKKKQKGIKKLELPTIIPPTSEEQAPDYFDDDEEYQAILSKFTPTVEVGNAHEEEEIDEEPQEPIFVSRQQVKRYGRPTIGMLKGLSRRPELIETFDNDAPDPYTLVEIKNTRNVVPVPSHWSQKRKYLNYKKGSEISRYRLPKYLEKTGIPQMRQALLEMEERKSLAHKQRDRTRPSVGLFDVSTTVLHDAFFKHQTKPLLTVFGEIYYEGKEDNPDPRVVKPGKLSKKLREALGMIDDGPPPWLFKMQKIGPPPSYPNLKISGLNAPLPPKAKWGDQPGGWGQVPIDDHGNPVWGGNPFARAEEEPEPTPLWGVMKRSPGIEDGVNI